MKEEELAIVQPKPTNDFKDVTIAANMQIWYWQSTIPLLLNDFCWGISIMVLFILTTLERYLKFK
jgi:hypothetical protein